MTVSPPAPLPEHGEDADDALARYEARVKRAVKHAIRRLEKLSSAHGGGTVALANTGSRGIRIVFVADDGTFGDVMVPSVAAADEVCTAGGWEITGWDAAAVMRISPTPADRLRMRGTGR